jgi:hypothetical protein
LLIIVASASRRGLAPSLTCHSAARWSPRKWDVAVDQAKIAELASLLLEGNLPTENRSDLLPAFTKRGFVLGACTSLICAPAIVRTASLMPVHALGPVAPQHYGWVQRVFIHCVTPDLSELTQAGMSAYGIAAELNRRKVSAVNGADVASVISATNLMKILEPNWRDCRVGSLGETRGRIRRCRPSVEELDPCSSGSFRCGRAVRRGASASPCHWRGLVPDRITAATDNCPSQMWPPSGMALSRKLGERQGVLQNAG